MNMLWAEIKGYGQATNLPIQHPQTATDKTLMFIIVKCNTKGNKLRIKPTVSFKNIYQLLCSEWSSKKKKT